MLCRPEPQAARVLHWAGEEGYPRKQRWKLGVVGLWFIPAQSQLTLWTFHLCEPMHSLLFQVNLGWIFLSLATKGVLIATPTLFSLDGFCHKNDRSSSPDHPLLAVENNSKLKCLENFFGLKTTTTMVITILAKPQAFPNFSAVTWQVHTIFCWQDVANVAAQRWEWETHVPSSWGALLSRLSSI